MKKSDFLCHFNYKVHKIDDKRLKNTLKFDRTFQ